jgi:hypothetical protein
VRRRELARASAVDGAAGLVGVAVMTVAEKIEQALTKRPDSFVPARALQVVDVLHKAVYSAATGVLADRWIRPILESRRGTTSR